MANYVENYRRLTVSTIENIEKTIEIVSFPIYIKRFETSTAGRVAGPGRRAQALTRHRDAASPVRRGRVAGAHGARGLVVRGRSAAGRNGMGRPRNGEMVDGL